MKKLIVLSLVFALVASAAFAADFSGTVFATVDVVKSDTGDDAKITSGAGFNRIRLDGGAAVNDNFGGYFRVDGAHWSGDPKFFGNAWWKPIDQLKVLVGSNGGDGFIGKEGNTGWMFYQTPTDTGTGFSGDNVWGGSIYGYGINTRYAFFEGGGDGDDAVYLFITPIDILSINIILPFFNGGELVDVFKKVVAQVDVNVEGVGDIALTYQGGLGASEGDPGSIFLYYGNTFGDLSIDFGFGYHFAGEDAAGDSVNNPIGIGLGVKYATDAFGVKFRTVAKLAGDDKETSILADVLPYFPLSENLTVFVSVGLGVYLPNPDVDDNTYIGWHFNPYIQIGEEWGAKFLAGIKLWSAGDKDVDSKGNKGILHWGVPIALQVSF